MSAHQVFAADWLSLREPADHAARSEGLFGELAAFLARTRNGRVLRIVDLGAGSGSNLRWLAPRLPRPQHWTLVDRDAGLLARARSQARTIVPAPADALRVTTVEADLSDSSLPWIGQADLVTAAAFFDLVSAAWIERLSAACAAAQTACLFVLSVDGRRGFLDHDGGMIDDVDDQYMQDLFNQHQRRDKGLGGALGPEAGQRLSHSLARHGFDVRLQTSDWRLDSRDAHSLALSRELLAGWRQAALEQAPAAIPHIDAWHQRRQADLAAARLKLQVGHVDVLALPPQ